jgi:hypothetical protein
MAFKTNNSIISRETGLISTKSALDLTSTASNETSLSNYVRNIAIGKNIFVVGERSPTSASESKYIKIYDFDGTLLKGPWPATNVDTGSSSYWENTYDWGYSIDTADNLIVLGAKYEGYNDGGAIFVTDLDLNPKWKVVKKSTSRFGEHVAIGDGRIVVGDPHAGTSNPTARGEVFIYDYNGNLIRQFNFPHSNATTNYQRFGCAVAIGNGRILIGAPYEDANTSYGDPITIPGIGFCYLYDLDGNLIKRISHYNIISGLSNGAEDYRTNYFGFGLDINHGKIVIGAPSMNRGNKTDSGRVFTFDINGENGAELLPSAPGQTTEALRFGFNIKIGCGRIYVGAPGWKITSPSIIKKAGKIFEFDINGNELQQITKSDASENEYFGGDFGTPAYGSQKFIKVGYGKLAGFSDSVGPNRNKIYQWDIPHIEDYFSKFTK